ncbi:MAG: class I tRNA ligase family protein [bacterium]|nr:class I tRNA ligase family protein [bacterium]
MDKYNPSVCEPRWQKLWSDQGVYLAVDFDKRPKKYVLIEFPYPSGERLHVGHGRSYTALDAYSRKLRMQGFNVMYPIGWDAFGLPAENYAIKTGINPQITTAQNIANSKEQAKRWGLSFDWSREINTTDPNYYKWTQWIFLKLYEKDLAYQAEVAVNWCPQCKTNLADEEVLADGRHERCGCQTERRMQKQWILKITAYAERLLDDLKTVNYLSKIRIQQENWIGKSEGTQIEFKIKSTKIKDDGETITVFTTRPDTLFGVTAMVVAPEHPIVASLLNSKFEIHSSAEDLLRASNSKLDEIRSYLTEAKKKSDLERTDLTKEKTGVSTGLYAINPINGEQIPIWIGDYVIGTYGGGAVMVVPAHDVRDCEFAKKYNLPIRPVVYKQRKTAKSFLMGAENISDKELEGLGVTIERIEESGDRWLEIPEESLKEYEKLISQKLTSGFWNEYLGKDVVFLFKHKDGKVERIILSPETEERIDHLGAEVNNEPYKPSSVWGWFVGNDWYHDLVVHEGEGILVNSSQFNGQDSVSAKKNITNWLTSHGVGKQTTNYHLRDWVFSRQHYWGEPIPIIHCDKCGTVPVPEKDLPVELPYIEKYQPSGTGASPLANVSEWVNVACPKCGGGAQRETDTMPNWAGSNWYYLAYLFADKLGVQSAKGKVQSEEKSKDGNVFTDNREAINYWMPVDLYNGGMEHTTLHLLYSRFIYKFLYDIGVVPTPEPYARRHSHGVVLGSDGQKISKSRGNVINPDDVVNAYGADTFRLYEMFMGPFEQMIAWSEEGVTGCNRFLKRVWQLASEKVKDEPTPKNIKMKLHQTIKKVTEDLDSLKFNTAIASMMEFINEWAAPEGFMNKKEVDLFLKILAPFAPFITEEIYQKTKGGSAFDSIHKQSWPVYDPDLVKEEAVIMVVQVNGKVREKLELENERAKGQEEVEKIGRESNKVKPYLEGKEVRKVIFVPGKLINFVVG